MGNKRIFLACQISTAAKTEISYICQRFGNLKFALRLTPKEKLHLTLAFLSHVPPEKLAQISQITKNVSRNFSKFSVFLSSLGAFPNLKLPKVVFVNLSGDTATLVNLTKKIQKSLENLGFKFDKEKFVPHITIARTKSYVNKIERKRLGETIQRWGKLTPLEIPVNAISIFESVPTSAGHVHTLLEKIPLKNEKA